MKEVELKTTIRAFKGNDPSEEYQDAEKYLTIQISDIVDKFDKNGDLGKTLFLRIKKERALQDIAAANADVRDNITGIAQDEAIEIANIMLFGANVTFKRQIFEKGEQNALENRTFDKATIVNSIVELELQPLGERAKKRIDKIYNEGEQKLEELKKLKEEETNARRAAIAAKIAASAAAEKATLLAAAPAAAPEPTLDAVTA